MAEIPSYPHGDASHSDAVGPERQEAAANPYLELVHAVMQASFDWSVGKQGSGVGSVVREFIEQRHADLPDADNLYQEAANLRREELAQQDREFTAARVTAQSIQEVAEEIAALRRQFADESGLSHRLNSLYNLLITTKSAHLDQSQATIRREELYYDTELPAVNPLKAQLPPL